MKNHFLSAVFLALAPLSLAQDRTIEAESLPAVALEKPANHGGFFAYCPSPDGKYVAGGTGVVKITMGGKESREGGEILLWNAKSGKITKTLGSHVESPSWVSFIGKGKELISYSREDGVVKLWKVSGKKAKAELQMAGPSEMGREPTIGDEGRLFVHLSQVKRKVGKHEVNMPGTLEVWDLAKKKRLWKLDDSGIQAFALDPTGKGLFVIVERSEWEDAGDYAQGEQVESYAALLKPEDGSEIWKVEDPRHTPDKLAFTPDGSTIIGAGYDTLYLWKAADGSALGEPMEVEAESSIRDLWVSEDSRILAVGRFMGEAIDYYGLDDRRHRLRIVFQSSSSLSNPSMLRAFDRLAGNMGFTPTLFDMKGVLSDG